MDLTLIIQLARLSGNLDFPQGLGQRGARQGAVALSSGNIDINRAIEALALPLKK